MASDLNGLLSCPRATGTLPMLAGTKTQMQGVGCKAVLGGTKGLAHQDLGSSGFPAAVTSERL
eukprot:1153295-Pelagomonas_calceolata.AAC.3